MASITIAASTHLDVDDSQHRSDEANTMRISNGQTTTASSSSILQQTLINRLQAELDVLLSTPTHQQHGNHDIEKDPRKQHNNQLAEDLLLAQSDTNASLYDGELIESYTQLIKLNTALRECLQQEYKQHQRLYETYEEYRDIHQCLLEQHDRINVMDGRESNTASNHSRHLPNDILEQQEENIVNQQLHQQLQYVTELIQKERNISLESSDSTLQEVIVQLLQRRIHNLENPYISIYDEGVLQLLRDEAHVVESYKNNNQDNLVCMVDYNSTEITGIVKVP